jgi:UDP-2,4-diacetamido-2,4,6-trideoxy-beta-L-altropyranose hydrolase
MKVLIHVDGGPGVGLGHVTRCVALARQLSRQGHRVQIAFDPELGFVDYVVGQGIEALSCLATAGAVREAAIVIGADRVIIDSYRWTVDDFRAVKGGWAVVAFDDEAVRELPVDAVINGAPSAVELCYRTTLNTRLWLGPAYQVLRDDFRRMPPRKRIGAVKQVIALVGGDDHQGLLPALSRLLDTAATSNSFVADVICGPFTSMPELIGLRQVSILCNPTDLPDRMARADLAVSASGQTLYELARCGTPTIAFCSSPDQIHNLRALSKADVVWNAGNAASPDCAKEIGAAITQLIGDATRRTAMSKAGQALIDGLGADRLVSAIESLRR